MGQTANPKPCCALISRDVRGLAQPLGMKGLPIGVTLVSRHHCCG
ncbi:hypothetical protein PSPO01_01396 [Paraphaeosphaeria sporulosa]